jgi:nucleoside diphosphate kinase
VSVGPLWLSAALGLVLETRLNGRPAPELVARSTWDAWWVAIRSGGQVRPQLDGGPVCPVCAPEVLSEVARTVPEHPGLTWRCDCFTTWATTMRNPSPVLRRTWALPQRLTVALLKPGAPKAEIWTTLRRRFRIVHQTERTLTPADCSRLYPDAYGTDFVAATTSYLTSGPCQVLVLVGGDDAVVTGLHMKRAVRDELAADRMRNHLHMPDTPAEALADIALLAGPDTLQTLYDRWEAPHDRHPRTRLAAYRARLDAGRRRTGVALPDR